MAALAKPKRLTYSLILVAVLAILSALLFGVFGVTMLADCHVLHGADSARLLELCGYLLLSGGISLGVAFEMGAMERVHEWLDASRTMLAPLVACGAFMVVGPALMLLNKHIMETRSFPYPLSLSALGLLASAAFSQVMVGSGLVVIQTQTRDALVGMNYARIVLPMGTARAITLATGNAVYLHLSLGFIQMLKAFMPAFVLVVAFIFRVDIPARSAVWCVLVIVAGTLVELQGELHATTLGLTLMLVSCLGDSICVVMSQKLMHNLNFTVMESMYFLSLPSVAILMVLAAILEWRDMFESGHYIIALQYPMELLAAAALGVTVNFLGFFVVSTTSSVFMKILNTVRCIGLVFVGSAFYGEAHSCRQLGGYAVSLVGFVGYTYFQRRQDHAALLEAWADGQTERARSFMKRAFLSNVEAKSSRAAQLRGESLLLGDIEIADGRT